MRRIAVISIALAALCLWSFAAHAEYVGSQAVQLSLSGNKKGQFHELRFTLTTWPPRRVMVGTWTRPPTSRAIEKREARWKNNDAEIAHLRMMLSAEYGEATARRYGETIIQTMTERSEEPLQTLPSLCRERVIEVFHEIQRRRSRKAV